MYFCLKIGDRDSVSSNCPQSLRFAACQLLKEITAYLRETHALLIAAQISSDNDSPLPYHRELSQSSSSRRQKHSIASALSKKIIEEKRKRSSVHALGSTFSNPEVKKDSPTSSPSPSRHAAIRKKSIGNILRSKSPKAGQRYSRQTSSKIIGDDPSNYEALLIDSEETSEFPWLDTVIEMNRSINFLCVHSTAKCPDDCPIEQIKCCNMLVHALNLLYDPGLLDEHELDNVDAEHPKRVDPVHEYITNQVILFTSVLFLWTKQLPTLNKSLNEKKCFKFLYCSHNFG